MNLPHHLLIVEGDDNMRTLYTLSTTTSTVPNRFTNVESLESLYNNDQENVSLNVPHCCENCPNRPTKDNPMRMCLCVLPTLEQIKY